MKKEKKHRVEGSPLMSGQDFCDSYLEVMQEMLAAFRKEVSAASPRTAFEWKLSLEYFTQIEAYAKETEDA